MRALPLDSVVSVPRRCACTPETLCALNCMAYLSGFPHDLSHGLCPSPHAAPCITILSFYELLFCLLACFVLSLIINHAGSSEVVFFVFKI